MSIQLRAPSLDYQLLNRAALVAYVGPASTIIVQTGPASGVWSRDDTATVNGGSVLAGIAPRKWVKQLQGLRLRDFGVIGDLTVDDTANLQAALTFAGSAKVKLNGENLKVRITAPITVPPNAALEFDTCGYSWGDPGIHVDFASATPGVTFSSGTHNIGRLGVYGQRVRVSHGILLDNAFLSTFDKIRVHGFQGKGVELRQTWDSTFGSISAEACGSTNAYAFSITDGTDTSNMLNIHRLQVEQAVSQAIYISPNTLSSVISNIHAERQTPAAGSTTFVLGGNRVQYNSLRLQCLQVGSIDVATVSFEGSSLTIANPLIEDGIVSVTHDAAAGQHTIVGGKILPYVQAKANQTGTVEYHGSELTELRGQGGSIKAFGGKIGTFRPGFCNASDPAAQFLLSGVKITTVTGADSTTRARFTDCTLTAFDPGQGAQYELDGCTVTGNARLAYGAYKLVNVNVNGTLSLDFARAEMRGGIINVMAFTAGSRSFNFRDVSFVTADVGANGIPTAGAWTKNQRHDNINPGVLGAATSQYIVSGWLCTVSGTPGTWVEQRTLTGT